MCIIILFILNVNLFKGTDAFRQKKEMATSKGLYCSRAVTNVAEL